MAYLQAYMLSSPIFKCLPWESNFISDKASDVLRNNERFKVCVCQSHLSARRVTFGMKDARGGYRKLYGKIYEAEGSTNA